MRVEIWSYEHAGLTLTRTPLDPQTSTIIQHIGSIIDSLIRTDRSRPPRVILIKKRKTHRGCRRERKKNITVKTIAMLGDNEVLPQDGKRVDQLATPRAHSGTRL